MIRILSFNPSLDLVMDVARFILGNVIRANHSSLHASGKGVNTAFASAAIDTESHVYCIVGEQSVRNFSDLHPLIACHPIIVSGVTRTNVTISERNTELICHIQTNAHEWSDSYSEALVDLYINDLSEGDVAIVSGSLPSGVAPELLSDTLVRAANKGSILIVDVDPIFWPSIDWEIVHWTKPNLEELSRHVRRSLDSDLDIYHAVMDCGLASRTVVSLGERGAILVSRNKSGWMHGQVEAKFSITTLPVGCGDSMVGGFAAAIFRGYSDTQVLQYGLAAGSANLAGPAPGRIDRVTFDSALKSIKMTKH